MRYTVENTFPSQQVAQYKAVFRDVQITEYHALFEIVPVNVLKSELVLGRTICKVAGTLPKQDRQFFFALEKGKICNAQEAHQIGQFKRPLEYHLDNLNLLTKNTRKSWSDSLMDLNLVELKQAALNGLQVVKIVPAGPQTTAAPFELSPLVLSDFRAACAARFSEFTFENVPDLEIVLNYLQTYPLESAIVVAPYVVAAAGLPAFYLCFQSMNEGNFFEDLFRNTLESVNNRWLSIRDYYNHRDTWKIVTCSLLAIGSGTIMCKMLASGLPIAEKLADLPTAEPVPVPVPVPIPAPVIKVDPLQCYRFTGMTGDAIQLFQTTTGGGLLAVLETFNGYRDIYIRLYIDPWVETYKNFIKR